MSTSQQHLSDQVREENLPEGHSTKKLSPLSSLECSDYTTNTSKDNSEASEGNKSTSNAFPNIRIETTPLEMKPIVPNPLFQHKNVRDIPVPRGDTPYCKAKRAEYIERDLPKAELYYKQAIEAKERLESSIKDLATVLHQQGKTQEAIGFLEENRHLYPGDQSTYDNLLSNLRKQIVPSGNVMSRTLVLFDCPDDFNEDNIRDMFRNSSRILQIEFKKRTGKESVSNDITGERICLIHFASYSAARKTLNTLYEPDGYQLYWMNINGDIIEKAEMDEKAKASFMKSMDLFYKSKSNPVDVKTYKKSLFSNVRANDLAEMNFSPMKGTPTLKPNFNSHSKALFLNKGSRLNPSILEELKFETNSDSSKPSSPYNRKKFLSSTSSPFNQKHSSNGQVFSPFLGNSTKIDHDAALTEGKLSHQNSLDSAAFNYFSSFITESLPSSQHSLDSKDDVSEKDLQFYFPNLSTKNKTFQPNSYSSLDDQ